MHMYTRVSAPAYSVYGIKIGIRYTLYLPSPVPEYGSHEVFDVREYFACVQLYTSKDFHRVVAAVHSRMLLNISWSCVSLSDAHFVIDGDAFTAWAFYLSSPPSALLASHNRDDHWWHGRARGTCTNPIGRMAPQVSRARVVWSVGRGPGARGRCT